MPQNLSLGQDHSHVTLLRFSLQPKTLALEQAITYLKIQHWAAC